MTALGIEYVDIQVDESQKAPLKFTFNWPVDNQWQGSDFVVQVDHAGRTTPLEEVSRGIGSGSGIARSCERTKLGQLWRAIGRG